MGVAVGEGQWGSASAIPLVGSTGGVRRVSSQSVCSVCVGRGVCGESQSHDAHTSTPRAHEHTTRTQAHHVQAHHAHKCGRF